MAQSNGFSKFLITVIAFGLIGFGMYRVGKRIGRSEVEPGKKSTKDSYKDAADSVDRYNAEIGKEFDEYLEFEKRNVTDTLKIELWQGFLDYLGSDNPYSSFDDTLRQKAYRKKQYWSSKNNPLKDCGNDSMGFIQVIKSTMLSWFI